MTSRIGLLGGTFDPIHNGHIAIAKTAIQQLKLDKLFLIPAGNPWQKSEFTDSKHRLEMVKRVVMELEKVEVDTLNRAYHKGHMDGESNKNPMANYYKNTHKVNSRFRTMLKK